MAIIVSKGWGMQWCRRKRNILTREENWLWCLYITPGWIWEIWDKVFKSGPSKICGRQLLKNLEGYGLLSKSYCYTNHCYLRVKGRTFISCNKVLLVLTSLFHYFYQRSRKVFEDKVMNNFQATFMIGKRKFQSLKSLWLWDGNSYIRSSQLVKSLKKEVGIICHWITKLGTPSFIKEEV